MYTFEGQRSGNFVKIVSGRTDGKLSFAHIQVFAYDSVYTHAAIIVGYSWKDLCYLIKNTWGPNFADEGYFKVSINALKNFYFSCLEYKADESNFVHESIKQDRHHWYNINHAPAETEKHLK